MRKIFIIIFIFIAFINLIQQHNIFYSVEKYFNSKNIYYYQNTLKSFFRNISVPFLKKTQNNQLQSFNSNQYINITHGKNFCYNNAEISKITKIIIEKYKK